jgi:flagellar biosynthetic protein FliP
MKLLLHLFINCVFFLLPFELYAASSADPGITAVTLTNAAGEVSTYSLSLKILLGMTALTFVPAILMCMTSFTRIIIVLAILRQAIGLTSTPNNQILIGIALFLSLFIMTPIFEKINTDALQPYLNQRLPAETALKKAEQPIRQFMFNQIRSNDLQLFSGMTKQKHFDSKESIPFTVLMPAFLTSELKTAFQMGFILFLPFLIIDLVVSSVLMAMGMMMLSPMIISLPFKILLFVLIDGWVLVMGTLSTSFGV